MAGSSSSTIRSRPDGSASGTSVNPSAARSSAASRSSVGQRRRVPDVPQPARAGVRVRARRGGRGRRRSRSASRRPAGPPPSPGPARRRRRRCAPGRAPRRRPRRSARATRTTSAHRRGDRQRLRLVAAHDDERVRLRRPRRDRRPLHREELAGEVDVVQLVAVDEPAGRLVADHRVVLPGVPQRARRRRSRRPPPATASRGPRRPCGRTGRPRPACGTRRAPTRPGPSTRSPAWRSPWTGGTARCA